MSNFITLSSTQAGTLSRYKREVRAIVVDRAADHIEQLLPEGRKPSPRRYEKAVEEGLLKAKLEVMAELFRIMHDLARDTTVAEWSRGEHGLRRKPRSDTATMNLIRAYDQIVRYVASIRAHAGSAPASGAADDKRAAGARARATTSRPGRTRKASSNATSGRKPRR